jgi:hypothetical protein
LVPSWGFLSLSFLTIREITISQTMAPCSFSRPLHLDTHDSIVWLEVLRPAWAKSKTLSQKYPTHTHTHTHTHTKGWWSSSRDRMSTKCEVLNSNPILQKKKKRMKRPEVSSVPPSEGTVRRWPAVNQEESPYQSPTVLAPAPQTPASKL